MEPSAHQLFDSDECQTDASYTYSDKLKNIIFCSVNPDQVSYLLKA